MRIDAACLRFVAIAGLCLATAPTMAFEPGTRHVCVPSSDGQSFECSDTATPARAAEPNETTTEPVPDTARADAVEAAPAPAAPANVSMAKPAPAAARPPSYLLQRPNTQGVPLPARTAVPAAAAAEPAAVSAAVPAAANAEPGPETDHVAPPAAVAAETPPPPAAPRTAAAEVMPSPASESAASSEPEPQTGGSEAARPEPAAAESTATADPKAKNAATAAPQAAAPAPMPRGNVLGADDFARLPGTHYTVVLASVRDPATLEALIAAMADRQGALYLLKLGMPDGDWYSLCWAEFDDVEAARAARVELPDVASLSSGWPRRIGLLQAEIAKRAASP